MLLGQAVRLSKYILKYPYFSDKISKKSMEQRLPFLLLHGHEHSACSRFRLFDLAFSRKSVTIRDVVSAVSLFRAMMHQIKSLQRSIYHAFAGILFDAIGTQQRRVNVNVVSLGKRAKKKVS